MEPPPTVPHPDAPRPRALGHRAPLLHLALPYFAGLTVGHAAAVERPLPLLAAALALAAAAGVLARRPALWAALLHLGLGAAGAASHGLHLRWRPEWDRLPPREAALALDVERLFSAPGELRAQGVARVAAAPPHLGDLLGARVAFSLAVPPAAAADAIRGARLAATGVLSALPRAPPAGGFDAFLTASGVQFRLARGQVTAAAAPTGIYPRFRAAAAHRLRAILGLGLEESRPDLAALLRGMMLGDTRELGGEERDRFRRSGTMHLFAISGLNIGVIAVALRALLTLARVPRWPGLVAGGALLGFFVDLTGASPSAVRAWAMAVFLQAAEEGRQPGNLVAALAASALAVLMLAPLDAFSTSFLLSYAIVLALLVLGLPLGEAWQEAWRPWAKVPAGDRRWWQEAVELAGRGAAMAVAVGVATTLVGLIAGVHFFTLLTPLAFLTNLILVPAASVVTLAGFAALLAGLAGWDGGAVLANHAAGLVLLGIDTVIRATVDLPGASMEARFRAPWIGPAALGLLTAALLAGYAWGWRRARGGWWPPFVVVALALGLGTEAAGAPAAMGVEVRPRRATFSRMKSAYELAMERLAKSDPATGKPLTADQKARLADIDRVYQGKLAEREIFLRKQLDDALAAQNAEEAAKIQDQMAREKARIEDDRETEKEKVRRGS